MFVCETCFNEPPLTKISSKSSRHTFPLGGPNSIDKRFCEHLIFDILTNNDNMDYIDSVSLSVCVCIYIYIYICVCVWRFTIWAQEKLQDVKKHRERRQHLGRRQRWERRKINGTGMLVKHFWRAFFGIFYRKHGGRTGFSRVGRAQMVMIYIYIYIYIFFFFFFFFFCACLWVNCGPLFLVTGDQLEPHPICMKSFGFFRKKVNLKNQGSIRNPLWGSTSGPVYAQHRQPISGPLIDP